MIWKHTIFLTSFLFLLFSSAHHKQENGFYFLNRQLQSPLYWSADSSRPEFGQQSRTGTSCSAGAGEWMLHLCFLRRCFPWVMCSGGGAVRFGPSMLCHALLKLDYNDSSLSFPSKNLPAMLKLRTPRESVSRARTAWNQRDCSSQICRRECRTLSCIVWRFMEFLLHYPPPSPQFFFLCTAPSSVSLAVEAERLNKEVLAWDKAQPGDC